MSITGIYRIVADVKYIVFLNIHNASFSHISLQKNMNFVHPFKT